MPFLGLNFAAKDFFALEKRSGFQKKIGNVHFITTIPS